MSSSCLCGLVPSSLFCRKRWKGINMAGACIAVLIPWLLVWPTRRFIPFMLWMLLGTLLLIKIQSFCKGLCTAGPPCLQGVINLALQKGRFMQWRTMFAPMGTWKSGGKRTPALEPQHGTCCARPCSLCFGWIIELSEVSLLLRVCGRASFPRY